MGLFSSIGKIAGVVAPLIPDPAISGALTGLGQMYANQQEVALANSSFQRRAADLKKAGLNPILAATNGNGAQTPQIENTSVSGMAAKTAARQLDLQEKDIRARTSLYSAQAEKERATVSLLLEQATTQAVERDYKKSMSILNTENARKIRQEVDFMFPKLLEEIDAKISNLKSSTISNLCQAEWFNMDRKYKMALITSTIAHIKIDQQNADSASVQAAAAYRNSEANLKNADSNAKNAETNAKNAKTMESYFGEKERGTRIQNDAWDNGLADLNAGFTTARNGIGILSDLIGTCRGVTEIVDKLGYMKNDSIEAASDAAMIDDIFGNNGGY